MRPITESLNLQNTSTTNVVNAQTSAGAGNLTLAATASAIDTSGAARILLITTTENDSGVNYTITGTDADGNTITEGPTALPNNTTAVTAKAYASVSIFNVSGAIAAALSVGTTNTTLTAKGPTVPLNFYNRIAPQVMVEVTGTINFTIQETFDNILGSGTSAAVWQSPTALATKTANTNAQLDVGATGTRVQINSYTNGATLTVRIIHPLNDSP